GAGGNGAGHRNGGGEYTDGSKMVLRQPHRGHAQGFGFIYKRKAFGKGLLLGHAVTTRKLDKQPEVHARPPFWSPETHGYLCRCDGTGISARVKSPASRCLFAPDDLWYDTPRGKHARAPAATARGPCPCLWPGTLRTRSSPVARRESRWPRDLRLA